MDTSDWRDQLLPEARQSTINNIIETLNMHHPVYDQEGLLELQKIAQCFEGKTCAAATSEPDYQRIISSKRLSIKTAAAQVQEEVFEKIQIMKEKYLPELNEMYQKIATKLQQHDSLLQSDQLEKLKIFKTILERIIAFLQVPKTNILPNYKEKLGQYEKQIMNFINTNRPRKAMSALQQGQLPSPQMHSMAQPQSQVTQVQSHDNQLNSQLQPTNLQGSVATMRQNNMTGLQHNSMSSMSNLSTAQQNMMISMQFGGTSDSGQGNDMNSPQQVAASSLFNKIQPLLPNRVT